MLLLVALAFLAIGVALGFLTGWDAPLGAALFRYDPALLNVSQAVVQRYVSPILWDEVALPLLERPSWVVPVAFGALLLALRVLLLVQRRRRTASV